MFNSKMSNVNAPFTPMGIAVWYNQGNKLSIVGAENKEYVQRTQFAAKMSIAQQGMLKAKQERLERTKRLAQSVRNGTYRDPRPV
jgi:hypothetical protein